MKLIRSGVFETNSSSTHSISISSGGDYESLTPDETGLLTCRAMSFGWEQTTYHDVESRLSYAMLYVRDWKEGAEQSHYAKTLTDMVCEHTGASLVVLEDKSDGKYGPDGYIDHQSVERGQLDHLFEDVSLLKNFVFARGSYVETDNDNHD